MQEIFKAYDIRGVYPEEFNEETAYKIGRAFVTFLKCRTVVVGQDMRTSSPNLFQALTKGITDQGADVIDIGLCSTPSFYFAAKEAKAAIMVTASHNPGKYNGLKLCRENAIPISGDTGIQDIKKLVEKNKFEESKKRKITKKEVLDDYIKSNLRFLNKNIKKLKIVIDAGNGMGGYTFSRIINHIPCEFVTLYMEPDGSFPNHEANPMKDENLTDLQKTVKKSKADFGIALDGDADRCRFVDEKGDAVSSDLTTALIAKALLEKEPGSLVLYDLRSSKAVKEYIEENKGKAGMCRVGHAFIKKQMRDKKAIFAGELSGHYYYKACNFVENTELTMILMINLLSKENKKLSELIKPLKRYFSTGEINFEVKDKDKKIKEAEKHFKNADNIFHLDGLSVEYKDWWFNLRKSNTEPLLRLNLEANTKALMEEKLKKVKRLIGQ